MNLPSVFILFPAVLFMCGCAPKNIVNSHPGEATQADVPSDEAAQIDTSDLEYLKKLPVYEMFGKPGHDSNNVVGVDRITDDDVKTAFFGYINLAQNEYDKNYDYWSSRFKSKFGYTYESGKEFRQALVSREDYGDEPEFKRVVEVLGFFRKHDVSVVKVRMFYGGYPVEYDKKNLAINHYVFVNEQGVWKWDGYLNAAHHYSDDDLREMGFKPAAIENRR